MRSPAAPILLLVLVLLPGVANGATPRGKPNTQQRAAWCYENHASCLKDGNSDCKKDYPKDVASRNICFGGVIRGCDRAFGPTGKCRTS